MNVSEAWAALGRSWVDVSMSLMAVPNVEDRVKAAEEMYAEAKKTAKKLMALHHPDTNPADPGAPRRFQLVKEAINTIEKSTADFRAAYEAKKAGSLDADENKGFIVFR